MEKFDIDDIKDGTIITIYGDKKMIVFEHITNDDIKYLACVNIETLNDPIAQYAFLYKKDGDYAMVTDEALFNKLFNKASSKSISQEIYEIVKEHKNLFASK